MVANATSPTLVIEDYLDLVDAAVAKVSRRVPTHVDRDDLRSAAMVALVKMLDGADELSRGAIYARVYGAVLDELRRIDSLSRDERHDARVVQASVDELTSVLGRQPIIPEIASKSGLSCSRVDSILQTLTVTDEFVDLAHVYDESPHPSEVASDSDAGVMLNQVLDRLPVKQAEAIRLVYFDGLTLEGVASRLGVSIERARQLRVAGEKRLRADADALDLWKRII